MERQPSDPLQGRRIAIVNDVAGVGSLQAKVLNAAGYSADFIDLPKPGASWPFLAKLLVLPVRLVQYIPIIRQLRDTNYDFVHIHFVSQGFIGPLSGKPYFLHAHGHDLHTNMSNPLLRWVSRRAMKGARAIFYVTPDLAQYLTEFRSKSYLLPNPLEPEFLAGVKTPTVLRKVLIFTRLYPVKGPEEIFEASPQLAESVELTAISWGPMAGRMRERFGRFVKFIDRVPHQQVASLIDGFDAVIGQMKLGILSLSELEAMARGRIVFMRLDQSLYADDPPPVVTIDGGDDLVAAIRRLQNDPGEIARLSGAGREWVARRHGLESYLEVLREGYSTTA
jgi:glycosyltransferase involved in cell wall biosynthesis